MSSSRRRPVAVAFLGVVLVGLASACSGDAGPERDDAGAIVAAGDESVFALSVGDCVVPPDALDTADVEQLRAVPCTEEHTHEVFATATYTASDVYPGEAELQAFADGACLDNFEDYVGIAYEESSLRFSYLFPSFPSWQDGEDRQVVCFIVSTDEPMTTSAKGLAR